MKGIDVSHWQGDINWQKVKSSGIDFAIIKATEGVGYVDPCFKSYTQGAASAGLHIGAYHFLRLGDAKQQAKEFINAIKPYKWDYPIAVDVEHKELLKMGRAGLTDFVIEFLDILKANGYYPMIYTGYNWCINHLYMSKIKYNLWFARYNDHKGYGNVSIWQYSSTGRVQGINGNVDIDISYCDYPYIIKSKGLNGYPKPQGFTCDTTTDISLARGQAYQLKVTSNVPPKVTVGTPNVVTLLPHYSTGNNHFYYLVGVGDSKTGTGIFVNDKKQFVVNIK